MTNLCFKKYAVSLNINLNFMLNILDDPWFTWSKFENQTIIHDQNNSGPEVTTYTTPSEANHEYSGDNFTVDWMEGRKSEMQARNLRKISQIPWSERNTKFTEVAPGESSIRMKNKEQIILDLMNKIRVK